MAKKEPWENKKWTPDEGLYERYKQRQMEKLDYKRPQQPDISDSAGYGLRDALKEYADSNNNLLPSPTTNDAPGSDLSPAMQYYQSGSKTEPLKLPDFKSVGGSGTVTGSVFGDTPQLPNVNIDPATIPADYKPAEKPSFGASLADTWKLGMDAILKENPIARFINRPFAKMAQTAVPDAPMIGKRPDGTTGELPGTNARKQFADANPIASTGNETADKALDFVGEMSAMFVPLNGAQSVVGNAAGMVSRLKNTNLGMKVEEAIGSAAAKTANAANPALNNFGIHISRELAEKTAKMGAHGAAIGGIYGAAAPLAFQDGDLSKVPLSTIENAALFAVGEAAMPFAGAAFKQAFNAVGDSFANAVYKGINYYHNMNRGKVTVIEPGASQPRTAGPRNTMKAQYPNPDDMRYAIQNRVIENLDDATKADYNQAMKDARVQGVSEDEANRIVMDTLSQTPEGEQLIAQAAHDVTLSHEVKQRNAAPSEVNPKAQQPAAETGDAVAANVQKAAAPAGTKLEQQQHVKGEDVSYTDDRGNVITGKIVDIMDMPTKGKDGVMGVFPHAFVEAPDGNKNIVPVFNLTKTKPQESQSKTPVTGDPTQQSKTGSFKVGDFVTHKTFKGQSFTVTSAKGNTVSLRSEKGGEMKEVHVSALTPVESQTGLDAPVEKETAATVQQEQPGAATDLRKNYMDLKKSYPPFDHNNHAVFDEHNNKVKKAEIAVAKTMSDSDAKDELAKRMLNRNERLQTLIAADEMKSAFQHFVDSYGNSGWSTDVTGWESLTKGDGAVTVADGRKIKVRMGEMFDLAVKHHKKMPAAKTQEQTQAPESPAKQAAEVPAEKDTAPSITAEKLRQLGQKSEKDTSIVYRGLSKEDYQHYLDTGEIRSAAHGVQEREGNGILFHSDPQVAILEAGADGHVVAVKKRNVKNFSSSVGSYMDLYPSSGKYVYEGFILSPEGIDFRNHTAENFTAKDVYTGVLNRYYGEGSKGSAILKDGDKIEPGAIITTGRGEYELKFLHPSDGTGPDPRHSGDWFADPVSGTKGGRMYFDPLRIKTKDEIAGKPAQKKVEEAKAESPVKKETAPAKQDRVKYDEPPKGISQAEYDNIQVGDTVTFAQHVKTYADGTKKYQHIKGTVIEIQETAAGRVPLYEHVREFNGTTISEHLMPDEMDQIFSVEKKAAAAEPQKTAAMEKAPEKVLETESKQVLRAGGFEVGDSVSHKGKWGTGRIQRMTKYPDGIMVHIYQGPKKHFAVYIDDIVAALPETKPMETGAYKNLIGAREEVIHPVPGTGKKLDYKIEKTKPSKTFPNGRARIVVQLKDRKVFYQIGSDEQIASGNIDGDRIHPDNEANFRESGGVKGVEGKFAPNQPAADPASLMPEIIGSEYLMDKAQFINYLEGRDYIPKKFPRHYRDLPEDYKPTHVLEDGRKAQIEFAGGGRVARWIAEDGQFGSTAADGFRAAPLNAAITDGGSVTYAKARDHLAQFKRNDYVIFTHDGERKAGRILNEETTHNVQIMLMDENLKPIQGDLVLQLTDPAILTLQKSTREEIKGFKGGSVIDMKAEEKSQAPAAQSHAGSKVSSHYLNNIPEWKLQEIMNEYDPAKGHAGNTKVLEKLARILQSESAAKSYFIRNAPTDGGSFSEPDADVDGPIPQKAGSEGIGNVDSGKIEASQLQEGQFFIDMPYGLVMGAKKFVRLEKYNDGSPKIVALQEGKETSHVSGKVIPLAEWNRKGKPAAELTNSEATQEIVDYLINSVPGLRLKLTTVSKVEAIGLFKKVLNQGVGAHDPSGLTFSAVFHGGPDKETSLYVLKAGGQVLPFKIGNFRDLLAKYLHEEDVADVAPADKVKEDPSQKLQRGDQIRVHFKDGSVHEMEYNADINGTVYLKTTDGQSARAKMSDIAKIERMDQAAAAKPETYPIYRRGTATENLDAENKPQGLYVSMVEKDFKTPHEDAGDTDYHGTVTLDNPLKPDEIKVEHVRFGSSKQGWASAGVAALKNLVPEERFKELLKMQKDPLIDLLNTEFPGPNYSLYYDSYELLEAYAAQLARKAGYDGIVLPDSEFPNLSEIAVLNNKGLKFDNAAEPKKKTAEKPEIPAATSGDPVQRFKDIRKAVRSGSDYTAADVQEAYGILTTNEAAIKADILKRINESVEHKRRKADTKAKMVEQMYDEYKLGLVYANGDSFTMEISWDGDYQQKRNKTIQKHIADMTEESVQAHIAKKQAKRDEAKKIMENPETLSELRSKKMHTELTPDEQARLDELEALNIKERKQEQKVKSAAVLSDTGKFTISETKHTKTGETIFVVKLNERVESDVFKKLRADMGRIGGSWSKFTGGFNFKADPREKLQTAFPDAQNAPSGDSPAVQAETAAQPNRTAQRLRELADNMQDTIDDKYRDRLTNTAKRSRESAYAAGEGDKLKRIQGILRNLSDAMESGQATHLDGITARTHIELLDRLLRNRVADVMRANGEKITDNNGDYQIRDPKAEDINGMEYPKKQVNLENLKTFLEGLRLAKISGTVRKAAKLDRLIHETLARQHLPNNKAPIYVVNVEHYMDDLLDLISIAKNLPLKDQKAYKTSGGDIDLPEYAERLNDSLMAIKRLQAMGIDTPEQLRSAMREFLQYREGTGISKEEKRQRELKAQGDQAARSKIPGFFPTPKNVVERMIDEAGIEKGMRVLEPSAGKGNIADIIRETHPDLDHNGLHVIEYNNTLRSILEEKDYNVVGEDFTAYTIDPRNAYDRIIMNPPFENGQDIDHVLHAFELLAPGGRIVAIMGEGSFGRSDAKATKFRDWLDEVGGVSEQLPDGSFKTADRPTGVSTRIVTIDKNASFTESEMVIPFFLARVNEKASDMGYEKAGIPLTKRVSDLTSKESSDFRQYADIARNNIIDGTWPEINAEIREKYKEMQARDTHTKEVENSFNLEDWEVPRDIYIERSGSPVVAKDRHAQIVKDALADGKPVPENVLADYPELQAAAAEPKTEDLAKQANEKVWYHGTGTADLTAEMVFPGGTDHEGLFGQGFYLTDNPTIAAGYAKSRSKRTNTPTIYETKVNVDRVLDLEKPLTKDVAEVLKKTFGGLDLNYTEDGGDPAFVPAIDAALEKGKTFEQTFKEIKELVADHSHDMNWSTNEYVDTFQEFLTNMKSAGYDAVTHTGGLRTGNDPHRVLIMLDPNDIAETGRTNQIVSLDKYEPAKANHEPITLPDGQSVSPDLVKGLDHIYMSTSPNLAEIKAIQEAKPESVLLSYARWGRGGDNKKWTIPKFFEDIGYRPRIILDSGAFTFSNKGKDTGLTDIMEMYGNQGETPEVAAMQVLNDLYATDLENNEMTLFHNFVKFVQENRKNVDWVVNMDDRFDGELSLFAYRMLREMDLPLMPVFHFGHDPKLLDEYVQDGAEYIGLGGSVGKTPTERVKWANEIAAKYPNVDFHLLGTVNGDIFKNLQGIKSVDGAAWWLSTMYPKNRKPGQNRHDAAVENIQKKESSLPETKPTFDNAHDEAMGYLEHAKTMMDKAFQRRGFEDYREQLGLAQDKLHAADLAVTELKNNHPDSSDELRKIRGYIRDNIKEVLKKFSSIDEEAVLHKEYADNKPEIDRILDDKKNYDELRNTDARGSLTTLQNARRDFSKGEVPVMAVGDIARAVQTIQTWERKLNLSKSNPDSFAEMKDLSPGDVRKLSGNLKESEGVSVQISQFQEHADLKTLDEKHVSQRAFFSEIQKRRASQAKDRDMESARQTLLDIEKQIRDTKKILATKFVQELAKNKALDEPQRKFLQALADGNRDAADLAKTDIRVFVQNLAAEKGLPHAVGNFLGDMIALNPFGDYTQYLDQRKEYQAANPYTAHNLETNLAQELKSEDNVYSIAAKAVAILAESRGVPADDIRHIFSEVFQLVRDYKMYMNAPANSSLDFILNQAINTKMKSWMDGVLEKELSLEAADNIKDRNKKLRELLDSLLNRDPFFKVRELMTGQKVPDFKGYIKKLGEWATRENQIDTAKSDDGATFLISHMPPKTMPKKVTQVLDKYNATQPYFTADYNGQKLITDRHSMLLISQDEMAKLADKTQQHDSQAAQMVKLVEQALNDAKKELPQEPLGTNLQDAKTRVIVFKDADGNFLTFNQKYYDFAVANKLKIMYTSTVQPFVYLDAKGNFVGLFLPYRKTNMVYRTGTDTVEMPKPLEKPSIYSVIPKDTVQGKTVEQALAENIARENASDNLGFVPGVLRARKAQSGTRPAAGTKTGSHAFTNPDIEKRFQASVIPKERLWGKIVEKLTKFRNRITREFEYLPHTAEFSQLRTDLLRLNNARGVASDRTYRNLIQGITRKLDRERYDLFRRKVFLDDLHQEDLLGNELPWGFDSGSLATEKAIIDAKVAQEPFVQEALTARKNAWDELKRNYIESHADVGNDVAKKLQRVDYIRHQVIDYANDRLDPSGDSKLRTPNQRGFLRQRKGSAKDINSDYLQAESEVMVQMLHDIERNKLIKLVDDKHNKIQEYKDQAKAANQAAIDQIILEEKASGSLMADILNKKGEKTGQVPLSWTEEELKGYSRKMAIAFDGFSKMKAADLWQGENGEFKKAVELLTEDVGKGSVTPNDVNMDSPTKNGDIIFRYVAALAKRGGDEQGLIQALTLLKAISGRRTFIKETLGDDFKTWKRMLPDDYSVWQPIEGDQLYSIEAVDAEKLARHIAAGLFPEINDIDDLAEYFHPVLAKGGRKREFAINTVIADTLDKLGNQQHNSFYRLNASIMRILKVQFLIGPTRVFRYNLRNLTGDLDKLLANNPGALKYVGKSIKELFPVVFQQSGMPPEMQEWFNRGGMHTLLQTQEMGDINKLKIFMRRYSNDTNIAQRLWDYYWQGARTVTDYREAIFRYANYLSYLEQIDKNALAGKGAVPNNYGSSIREEVDALENHRDKAFKLANESLIDYNATSALGKNIRETAIPFWSFMEGNMRTTVQYLRNAAMDERVASAVGRRLLGKAVARSPYYAYKWGKAAIMLSAFTIGIQAWNYLPMNRDEEEDLPESVRRSFHLITGREADGTPRYFSNVGVMKDFLEWFGADTALYDMYDIVSGRRTFMEVATTNVKKLPNKLINSGNAAYKFVFEEVTGRKLFPDAFNTTQITDRGSHFADLLGFKREYNAVKDLLLGQAAADYKFRNLVDYGSNPGEAAYYDIISLKKSYMKRLGKAPGKGSLSPKSEALYELKRAMRFGDEDAIERFTNQYVMLGGTARGLNASLRALDPLSGLSKDDQGLFMQQMHPQDKIKLERAMQFYINELLGLNKQQ